MRQMVRLRRGPSSPPSDGPPAQPEDLELAKVQEAILRSLAHSGKRDVQMDQVQVSSVVQEDPHYTFVPVGSNEEVNIALVSTFPWIVSEESGSEQRIPPGPPLEGHLVIHQSAVPCAPPEMFHAGIIKTMDEAISVAAQELWISAHGQGNGGA